VTDRGASQTVRLPSGASPPAPAVEPGERARRRLFLFLGGIVALVPLPLGAARPLAWDVLAVAVAAALLWSVAVPDKAPAQRSGIMVPAGLFLLVLAWIMVQTSGSTPAAWHAAVWQEAGEALRQPLSGAVAVDRQAALAGLLRIFAYAGVFYLSLRLCRDSARAHLALRILAISGSVYAAYGLLTFWSGNKRVLWLMKTAYLSDLTGPFINRNSFGTYLGICLLAVVCGLLDGFTGLPLFGSWRTRLAMLFEFLSRRVWHLLSLFLVATALVLTHSRGGFVAALVGLLALGLLLWLAPARAGRGAARWAAAVSLLALLAIAISGGPTLARLLGTDIDSEERVAVYERVIAAIEDHPLTGTGLGSFRLVFPSYRTPAIKNLYDRAHNDYLEAALELGIPAAVCQVAAIFWLALVCLRGARRRRRDAVFPCLGLAASVLVGAHALTDFSLQIPAVATVYAFVLGLGVAQSQSSRPGSG
jgi:O-antigen ligase